MFYYSKKSRGNIVHCEGCGHINKIKPENLEKFNTNQEIRGGGYRMCSCCSPLMKKLRTEKAELQKFCGENGLMYFICDGNMHIHSDGSKWVIIVSAKRSGSELHHENLYNEHYNDSVPGYHNQHFSSNTLMGYMDYIARHDAYRRKNPLRPKKAKKPPKKGTKSYKRYIKNEKKKEKRRKVRNVLNLIDSLSAAV